MVLPEIANKELKRKFEEETEKFREGNPKWKGIMISAELRDKLKKLAHDENSITLLNDIDSYNDMIRELMNYYILHTDKYDYGKWALLSRVV